MKPRPDKRLDDVAPVGGDSSSASARPTPGRARTRPSFPFLNTEVAALAGLASVAALCALAVVGLPAALATILAFATFLPYAVARAEGRVVDFGDPIYAVSGIYLLIFALRTYYILAEPVQMVYFSARPYRDALSGSLASALLGYVILVVAYYSGLGPWLASHIRPPVSSFSAQRPRLRVVSIFVIGLIPQAIVLVVVGRSFNSQADSFSFSGTENLTLQLTLFIFYGLTAASLLAARRRGAARDWRSVALVGGMLVVIALAAFAYAYKAALIFAVAIVALAAHYRYRPLSPRAVAVAVGLLVFVIFPVVNAERALINEGRLSRGGIVGRIEAGTIGSVGRLVSSGPRGYLDASLGGLLRRSNGVDSLALIERYTPEVRPYQHGVTYVALPAEAYVPRALWPGKPIPLSSDFARLYGGRPGIQTNFSITNFGDLYMNFGIWGILVGAAFIGVIYRLIYETFVVRTNASDSGLLIYIGIFLTMIPGVEQELMPVFSQILKALPILFVVAFVLTRNVRVPSLRRTTATPNDRYEQSSG